MIATIPIDKNEWKSSDFLYVFWGGGKRMRAPFFFKWLCFKCTKTICVFQLPINQIQERVTIHSTPQVLFPIPTPTCQLFFSQLPTLDSKVAAVPPFPNLPASNISQAGQFLLCVYKQQNAFAKLFLSRCTPRSQRAVRPKFAPHSAFAANLTAPDNAGSRLGSARG